VGGKDTYSIAPVRRSFMKRTYREQLHSPPIQRESNCVHILFRHIQTELLHNIKPKKRQGSGIPQSVSLN